jgi:hypothetical protein
MIFRNHVWPGTEVHTCNPRIWEAKARKSQVQGQSDLHSRTLFKKKKKKKKQLESKFGHWVNFLPTVCDYLRLSLGVIDLNQLNMPIVFNAKLSNSIQPLRSE